MSTKVIRSNEALSKEIDLSENKILDAIWDGLANTPLGTGNNDVKNMIMKEFLDQESRFLGSLTANELNNLKIVKEKSKKGDYEKWVSMMVNIKVNEENIRQGVIVVLNKLRTLVENRNTENKDSVYYMLELTKAYDIEFVEDIDSMVQQISDPSTKTISFTMKSNPFDRNFKKFKNVNLDEKALVRILDTYMEDFCMMSKYHSDKPPPPNEYLICKNYSNLAFFKWMKEFYKNPSLAKTYKYIFFENPDSVYFSYFKEVNEESKKFWFDLCEDIESVIDYCNAIYEEKGKVASLMAGFEKKTMDENKIGITPIASVPREYEKFQMVELVRDTFRPNIYGERVYPRYEYLKTNTGRLIEFGDDVRFISNFRSWGIGDDVKEQYIPSFPDINSDGFGDSEKKEKFISENIQSILKHFAMSFGHTYEEVKK